MAEFVCIREFEHRVDAGRAESALEAESITVVVLHDDAAGWWGEAKIKPLWERARLLVPQAEADRARSVHATLGI